MRDIKAYHMASGESHIALGGQTMEGYKLAVQEIVQFMAKWAPHTMPKAVISEIYITDADGTLLELQVMDDILTAFKQGC